jgi:hypothetical protein
MSSVSLRAAQLEDVTQPAMVAAEDQEARSREKGMSGIQPPDRSAWRGRSPGHRDLLQADSTAPTGRGQRDVQYVRNGAA